MKILSRSADDVTIYNEAVQITFRGLSGTSVRIGIESLGDVHVDRAELPIRKESFANGPAYAALGAVVDVSDFLTEADLAW